MNAKDRVKVLNAGFIIIREHETGMKNQNIAVYCKTKRQPEWHNYQTGFPSKAARRRFMDESLKSDMIIED